MVKKHNCKLCNYDTTRLSDYKKHLQTKKHQRNLDKDGHHKKEELSSKKEAVSSKKGSIDLKKIKCIYCHKLIHKTNRARHLKVCKVKLKLINDNKKKQLETDKMKLEQRLEEEILEKVELQKRNKQIEEENRVLLEQFNKCLVKIWEEIKTPQVVNIQNNINVEQLTIRYVRKNFNDAHNYEDLMESQPTDVEIEQIEESPINGCYQLVKSRCIDGIEFEKRPFHCLDSARQKFALRTKDEWIDDQKGENILNEIEKIVSSIIEGYDLTNNDNIKKQVKILKQMIPKKYKIINYLMDDTILKNNAKLLKDK